MDYKSLDSKLLRSSQINQNHVVLSLKVLLTLFIVSYCHFELAIIRFRCDKREYRDGE